MIVSALSLFRKFNLTNPLKAEEGELVDISSEMQMQEIAFSGHACADGDVRVFARLYRPTKAEKTPVVLLLCALHQTKEDGEELASFFVKKGYSVFLPDYKGEWEGADERRTVYPPSLSYANLREAELYKITTSAENTCWFEWTYVALYAVEYLKTREDITEIGGVGIRTGGEILWKAMLSPDIKCGIPVNSAGWQAYFDYDKFSENLERNMSDERHAYIAGVESQSYAPFVKCPVLMPCSMRDYTFDYDRAHDTFSRLTEKDGCAIVYSPDSGPCIGPYALKDMELFLERNLKGRAIFIPHGVDLNFRVEEGELVAELEADTGGIIEEVGVFYAETGAETESAFREWQCILKEEGKALKNGKISCAVAPFKGAKYVFAYAYARYINGFKVTSKIIAKKLDENETNPVKTRVIYSGEEVDCFTILNPEQYADGGIFLESIAVPKQIEGYGKIKGAYSPGGIRTYKIGSPRYEADETALLEFDAYAQESFVLNVFIERSVKGNTFKKYKTSVEVKGGGKWKRNILKADDFKCEETGESLKSFSQGIALAFTSDTPNEYAVTNILWL